MENNNDDLMPGVDEELLSAPSEPPQDEISADKLSAEDENSDNLQDGAADQAGQDENNQTIDGAENSGGELLETDSEALDGGNGENTEGYPDGDNGESMEAFCLMPEDLQSAAYAAMKDYFAENIICVDVQEKGIDTPLEELGLRDVLLFVLVLVALGRAVSDIIGGKGRWRK